MCARCTIIHMFNAIINFFTGLIVSVTTFFGGTTTVTDTLLMRAVIEPGVAPRVTLVQSLKDSKTSFVTLSNDGKATVIAPKDSQFAKVYVWGGAGGSFGNDGGPFAVTHVLGFNPQNMPGGHGGYVSGKIPVSEAEQFKITLGTAGPSGYYKGDNNDWIGGPGKATRVSFDNKEIMVAGAGSNLSARTFVWGTNGWGGWEAYNYDWVNGGHTQLLPLEKYVDELRSYFANGGSPAAGVLKSGGLFHPDFDKFNGDPKTAFPQTTSWFGSVGGDGKQIGSWSYKALHPTNAYVYTLGLTGGTSYVDTSLVSEPVYYSGDPEKNSADGGLWKQFLFKSSNQFGSVGAGRAMPFRAAGNGAVIVEFYTSTSTVTKVPDLVVETNPFLNLRATVDSQSVDKSTTVSKDSNVTLSWSFTTIPDKSTCTLSKITSGGTDFTTLKGAVLDSRSSIETGPLSPATYTYELKCQDPAVSSSVTFVVVNSAVCLNGATNYPECTLLCSNGASNPPTCTTDGNDGGPGIVPGGGGTTVVDTTNQKLTLPDSGTINVKYIGGKNGKSEKKTISLGVYPKDPPLVSPTLSITTLPTLPKGTSLLCASGVNDFDVCEVGSTLTLSSDGFGGYTTSLRISISDKLPGDGNTIGVRASSGSLLSNVMSLKILQDAKNPNFTEF